MIFTRNMAIAWSKAKGGRRCYGMFELSYSFDYSKRLYGDDDKIVPVSDLLLTSVSVVGVYYRTI